MKVIAMVIILFISEIIFAQAPLVKQWDKRYGGTFEETLISFQQTADGGYILGGYSVSDSSGDKTQRSRGQDDYWLVKTDSLGNKQWDKRFGGMADDVLYALQQTTDRGFILGGLSLSDSSGDKLQNSRGYYDYWLVKTDSLGNKQWDKRFGGTGGDYLSSLQQTADRGFILGGYSFSDSSGDRTQHSRGSADYWLVKTDSLGNKQWDKRFGGTGEDYLYSLLQTADKGFILGGYSYSDSSGDKSQNSRGSYDYWLVKTDSLGNKQWDKRFGGTGVDWLFSLQQTADRGFILGGVSSSDSSGDKTVRLRDSLPQFGASDFWLVKIDSGGNKQWDKKFGGLDSEDAFGSVTITNDGGYLLAGTSYSAANGDKSETNLSREQTWVVKTDSAGNKQWDKTLRTLHTQWNIEDELGLAIQTRDGCYVMANWTSGIAGGDKTEDSWNGSNDYWFIKFCDTTTTIIGGEDNLTVDNAVSVFPNPSLSNWQLEVGNNFIGSTAEVFDINGRVVFQQLITEHQSLITFDAPRGVYLLRIASGKSMVVRKLVRL